MKVAQWCKQPKMLDFPGIKMIWIFRVVGPIERVHKRLLPTEKASSWFSILLTRMGIYY